MALNTQSKSPLQGRNLPLTLEIDCPFFRFRLETDPSADPGGDGGHPTTLTLSPEQGEETKITFVGTQEFANFQTIVATLHEVLEIAYGPSTVKTEIKAFHLDGKSIRVTLGPEDQA